MSSPALICDTGALLDYLDVRAADHQAFRDTIDEARTRYVPGLVLAEVDYFLQSNRTAMRALVAELVRGTFTYAPPTLEIVERAMEIDRAYADLAIGLVDASIVALAEQLGVCRVATRDVRHFSSVRLRGGRAFDLVVWPTRPDGGTMGPFKLEDASIGGGGLSPEYAAGWDPIDEFRARPTRRPRQKAKSESEMARARSGSRRVPGSRTVPGSHGRS